MLVFGGLLAITPTVAAVELYTEGFESFTLGTVPTGWAEDTNSQFRVSSAQAHSGAKSVFYTNTANTAAVYAIAPSSSNNLCAGATSSQWVKFTSLPASGNFLRQVIQNAANNDPDSSSIMISSTGAVTVWDLAAGHSASLGTVSAGSWFDLNLLASCTGSGTAFTVASVTLGFSATVTKAGVYANIQKFIWHWTSNPATTAGPTATLGVYFDDFGGFFAPTYNEVAVSALVGGSMDNLGQTIVVRNDSGDTVATYGVGDLAGGAIATVATPNCNIDGTQFDGVNAAAITIDDVDEVFVTYLDCAGDGDSDSFKIRDSNLLSVEGTFPCSEAEDDVDHAGGIVIPENIGEIGIISDLNPSYIGRCDAGPFDSASVGWMFSTVGTSAEGGGRIGAAAYTFNFGAPDESTDGDADTIIIDSTANPEVTQFCAWQNQMTGRDYMAGASIQGSTKVVEVESSVVKTANSPAVTTYRPEVDLTTVFTNAGTYAFARGLACAQDTLIIEKGNTIYAFDNITTGSPDLLPGWPITVTNGAVRGVALTGSARFVSVVNNGEIDVYARNATLTGSFPVPSGVWRSMEFDNGGEVLAVFTSTTIRVYDSSNVTCGLEGDCAVQGGVGDDPPICPLPPCDIIDEPETGSCDGAFCVDDDTTIPTGFTVATFKGFLGIVLIAGVVGVGRQHLGKSGAVIGIFVCIGILLGFYTGYIDTWVIVVACILSLGAFALLRR